MNRSKTITLAAQAMLSAVTSAYCRIDTRHAGDNYSPCLVNADDDSNPDAGGTDIKKDVGTVVAKGETVRDGAEGTEQTQQQAAAASTVAPGTETGALGGETKAIGEPPAGQTQQT